MKEKWKPWIGTYFISDQGRVKNNKTSRILKGSVMNIATYVEIRVDGKKRTMSVNKAMREIWQK